MGEMTIEQQRTIALARARRRRMEQQQTAPARPTGPDPEVPVLGAPVQPGIPREEPVFTPVEYLKGTGEAALTGLSANTTGLFGQGVGFLKSYGEEALAGTLGTQEAARRIQEKTLQAGQGLTYPTTSPAGQYLLGKVGDLTEPFAALDPVLTPRLLGDISTIRQGQRQLGKLKSDIPLSPAEDAAAAAQKLDIPVMRSDVVEPGKIRRGLEQFTGGMREKQEKARVNAIRQTLADYGATTAANASDDVLKDLRAVDKARFEKYSAQKQEVIDSLSDVTYLKKAETSGFKSTATVPMTNLNKYIDDQLYGKRDLVRLAEQGDADAAVMVRELTDLQASFANNTRLSDIEFKRKMLGETYSSEAVKADKIKPTSKSIIDDAYGPVLEDMGAYIEANGSKADRAKWRNANAQLKQGLDALENKTFANMLRNNEVDADTITKQLLSKNKEKIRMIYANSSDEGKASANRLFLNQAYAYSTESSVDSSINPVRFNKFLKEHSKVLDFMPPDMRAQLQGLNKALTLTGRATGARAKQISVNDNLNIGEYLIKKVLAHGGGNFAARVAESPRRVKVAFMNLGKAPPGSRAESMAINGLNAAIIAENNRLAQEAQRQQQQAR